MQLRVELNKNTKCILSLLCICISSVQAEDSVTLKTAAYDVQTSIQHDQFKSDFGNKGDAISPIQTRSLVLTKWQTGAVLTIIVVLVAGAYWKLSAKKTDRTCSTCTLIWIPPLFLGPKQGVYAKDQYISLTVHP